MTPGDAADVNTYDSPTAQSIGVGNRIGPRHIVAIQLKILIPVGTAMKNDDEAEERQGDRAGREHVVRPDRHRQARDRGEREHHRPVAEDRLALNVGTTSDTIPKPGGSTM